MLGSIFCQIVTDLHCFEIFDPDMIIHLNTIVEAIQKCYSEVSPPTVIPGVTSPDLGDGTNEGASQTHRPSNLRQERRTGQSGIRSK
jgi:hypothetical protein